MIQGIKGCSVPMILQTDLDVFSRDALFRKIGTNINVFLFSLLIQIRTCRITPLHPQMDYF